ncbi:MAG: L-aspartate oxidase [candidate division Zixibacteria bacterium]|nr:L-aspartate oxidase [candidate division Zixibacteria bacterium]MCI0595775.1 L-aspartate oxidase [candidate division Zixibacteria bacterium]
MAARSFDFLVLGSGVAGLSFALKVAPLGKVAVVTKKKRSESNTNYAQGGIAAVFDSADSFEKHVQDTLTAGAGLCKEEIVRQIVQTGPRLINELANWGAQFSREDGRFALGREGGHSQKRVVHARDFTGRELERSLVEKVKREKNIEVFEHHFAFELLKKDGRVWGAYTFDSEENSVETFLAPTTLLATGGCGRLWKHTTNPPIATGDGLALACRAGAELANLEFMQFHPTAFYHAGDEPFLITEAVRGEGALLRTKDGTRFMEDAHPQKELAPRDIVARAIDRVLKQTGEDCVFLDLTHLEPAFVERRFPQIFAFCRQKKLDLSRDKIPVVPAAHYMCGGVVTDVSGQANLPGLLAAGEVACTGMHGANRLASNSLLEALATADFAAQKVKAEKRPTRLPEFPAYKHPAEKPAPEKIVAAHEREAVASVMWDYVGIVRTNERLALAAERLAPVAKGVENFYYSRPLSYDSIELHNLATVSRLVVACAQKRKESRGLHYNLDYPETSKGKPQDTVLAAGLF